jgi:hypothetical protein
VLLTFAIVRHLSDAVQVINELANCPCLFGFGEGDAGLGDVRQSAFHVRADGTPETVHVHPGMKRGIRSLELAKHQLPVILDRSKFLGIHG